MADNRDWDKQMAEIDRLMKKQGISADAPTPAAAPVKGAATKVATAAPALAPAPVLGRGRSLQLWLVAALGPLGAGGLLAWPYARGCGLGLGVYLVGVAAVLAAGLVTMRTGWGARRGWVATVGLLTLLLALALTAREVLPRVGYAASTLSWTCST